jgi:hypothetical protein
MVSINENERAKVEAEKAARMQAEREALDQAIKDRSRINAARRQAADDESRIREALLESQKIAFGKLSPDRGRSPTRNIEKSKRDDSTATVAYPEGEYVVNEGILKPTKKKSKLESEGAMDALNTGLSKAKANSTKMNDAVQKGVSKAARIVPGKTALNAKYLKGIKQGLTNSKGIVPGKTATNAKYMKGIKQGLTNTKVKAQLEPQPNSATTVLKKNKTPVLPMRGTSLSKVRKGPMEKVRALALPVR